jgi:hypothetical protein
VARLHAGFPGAATADFVWLWNNIAIVSPSMIGVRGSFLVSHIQELVARHPPARVPFARLRDRAAARAAVAERYWSDWACLNKILGESHETLAWFDTVKHDPAYAEVLDRMPELVPLLAAHGRWAEIGGIWRDPQRELSVAYEAVTHHTRSKHSQEIVQVVWRYFRRRAASLRRSLAAAGRDEEAAAIEREALRLDPSEQMREALLASPADG